MIVDAAAQAGLLELRACLKAIGAVYAQKSGTIICPRCQGELGYYASYRTLWGTCKTPGCVEFRVRGEFKRERLIPVYKQDSFL